MEQKTAAWQGNIRVLDTKEEKGVRNSVQGKEGGESRFVLHTRAGTRGIAGNPPSEAGGKHRTRVQASALKDKEHTQEGKESRRQRENHSKEGREEKKKGMNGTRNSPMPNP